MKKLSILLLGIMALGAVSCEDGPSVPPIQTNPQGPVYEVEGVTVEQPSETSIVLQQYADQGNDIPVGNFLISEFPEGYDMNIVAYISKDETFTTSQILTTTLIDNTAFVTPEDFESAYVLTVGKSPAAKDVYVRFAVYATNGTNEFRLGNEDTYLGGYSFNVTPFPKDIVIEDNYYLLGTINGWDVATAIKFNHSEANPYDDPVFTLGVDISSEQAAEGWWWKIVPESTFITGGWVDAANASFGVAVNGDTALEGVLVGRTATEDCGAGCIVDAGQYLITINMEEGTYSFTSAVPYLYTPGAANDWNQNNSQRLYTTDYTNYYGYANLSTSGFKFTSAPDWDHVNYGSTGEEGTLSTDGGANNLTVPANGLYWCSVNTSALTYSLTQIETIGVIGDATPEGWNASTPLTPSADNLTWSGDITFGSGEFKFRANDGWDINLGGSIDNLQQDGGNLASPGSGTYHVVLNLATLPYTAQLTKK